MSDGASLGSFWTPLLVPVAVGVLGSFVIERACRPRPISVFRRGAGAIIAHVGFWLILFTAEFAAFRRPWFAACNVDALFLGLVLVNDAKVHSLREPFLYQDFDYFTDALKHPRLYVPFFGMTRLMLAVLTIVGVIVLGMRLEGSVTASASRASIVWGFCTLSLLAVASAYLGARLVRPARHEPEADMRALGVVGFWCRYALDERKDAFLPPSRFERSVPFEGDRLPHLVAVQSESFFDVRRISSSIEPEVLREFDRLNSHSLACGTLEVAAWGANTVRTEFSFLSGIAPAALGVHRFNPYRGLERMAPVGTIASFLRAAGYRTLCLHPYPAEFYARDRVLPRLGFDEFLDIRAFERAERCGPFVSDGAVAERILAELGRAQRPCFIFAITMENHGPLHLETPTPGEAAQRHRGTLPLGCEDLIIYLRHLANADAMLKRLQDGLESLEVPAGLCFFGDHVPIMSKVYEQLGLPDGRTDYLIWASGAARFEPPVPRIAHTVSIEALAALYLARMGWASLA